MPALSRSARFQSTHPQGVGRLFRLSVPGQLRISIHPPARGGTNFAQHIAEALDKISIHPPARGGTQHTTNRRQKMIKFQSTHPQGVGLHLSVQFRLLRRFQSTHPQGVGPAEGLKTVLGGIFQSTHPQGVGHAKQRCSCCPTPISIHPPARGGTNPEGPSHWFYRISIHPPARGGTTRTTRWRASTRNFNPPTRKGWDGGGLKNRPRWHISIHPPARGGTRPYPAKQR